MEALKSTTAERDLLLAARSSPEAIIEEIAGAIKGFPNGHPTKLILESALNEIENRTAGPAWTPIEGAPDKQRLPWSLDRVLAATDDGCVMAFNGHVLAAAMGETTPRNLTFPATHYMAIPALPRR